MAKTGKHTPQRQCVSCKRRSPKDALLRFVATLGQGIAVDLSGKAAGRGVYICNTKKCLQESIKKSRLEFALRTRVSEEMWFKIVGIIESKFQKE